MEYIDLHTHSICSDGADTPRKVVSAAREAGLSAIALSDHDTTDGLPEAIAAGEDLGVRVIPAVEMSADFKTEMHILGYGIDYTGSAFHTAMEKMQEFRLYRNQETAHLLQDAGIDVSFEEAAALSGGELIGRVHFAMVMVLKGYSTSVKEAFDEWLSVGKPGYFRKQKFTPEEVIALIRDAGGVAVLAHPKLLKLPREEYDALFGDLKEKGLFGVECYYNAHTDEERDFFLSLSHKHGLVPTGGSDYHGKNKPHVSIGKVYGNRQIPMTILEEMDARAGKQL